MRASGERREKRGRQPEKKNEPLSSRAFSHGRGHLRVSLVLIDGTRKKGDCSKSIVFATPVLYENLAKAILLAAKKNSKFLFTF